MASSMAQLAFALALLASKLAWMENQTGKRCFEEIAEDLTSPGAQAMKAHLSSFNQGSIDLR